MKYIHCLIVANIIAFFYSSLNAQDQVEENKRVKGVILSKRLYKLHNNGTSFSDSDLVSKGIMKFDNNNNPVEVFLYTGTVKQRVTWRFSDDGKVLERDYFKPDGSLESKATFQYDAKGRGIEFDHSNAEGLERKSLNTYDDNDNTKTVKNFDNTGALIAEVIEKYNDKHQLIATEEIGEVVTKLSPGVKKPGATNSTPSEKRTTQVKKTYIKYDDKGNQTEKETLIDGKLWNTEYFKYDERGNVILKISTSPEDIPNVVQTKYIYDSAGNWIVMIKSTNELTLREIKIP